MGAFDPPDDQAPPDDRPSFNNSGGVMGQWPLAGATGYTPQGQGLTGFDSQGAGMGAGSVAKSAGGGFGDMFGDGLRTGGRVGFEDGGFTDPALEALLKPKPFNLLEGIQPLPIGTRDCRSPRDGEEPGVWRRHGQGDLGSWREPHQTCWVSSMCAS